MKKTIRSLSMALCLLLLAMTFVLPAFAAGSSATLTGPGEVRAGDTISLAFKLKGSGILGMRCELSYDSSQVTLSGIKQDIKSPWMIETNGNIILGYDNNQTNPVSSETKMFTATFKVKANLAAGTKITVTAKDATTSDGSKDTALSGVSYTATILAPKSSDATLKTMKVGNATISPSFSSSVTDYKATVPFSVKSLVLDLVTSDAGATFKVSGNSLTVGSNTVSVKVTAENGATKTYTIKVTREQDPNYVPASDAMLKSLTVSSGALTPAFSKGQLEYAVYLPNEVTSLTVTGTPNDSKGSCEKITAVLSEGRNKITVYGVAEDGSKQVYYVYAVRMPSFYSSKDLVVPGESGTDPTPVETDPVETEPKETEPKETEPKVTEPPETEPKETEPKETKSLDTEAKNTDTPETKPAENEKKIGAAVPVLSVLLALSLAAVAALLILLNKKSGENS